MFNQQCIRWSVIEMIISKNRAVEIKYHEMVVDILTKALGWIRFSKLRDQLKIINMEDSHESISDCP